MERCDFASITAVLRRHLIEGSFQNQVCFVNTLFESYICENGADFDNGLLNKWLNGLAKVSVPIGQFYNDSPKYRSELAETLRDSVFSRMADSSMAVREVHALLLRDTSVSDRVKADMCYRLCKDTVEITEEADFLADVLIFGIVRRPFVLRDIRKSVPMLETEPAPLLCVRSAGNCSVSCSYQCGRSQTINTFYNVYADRGMVTPQAVQDTSPCESMIRLVWNVAHIQNSEDFQRGIAVLREVNHLFGGKSKYAPLLALCSVLQGMHWLHSSFGDHEKARMEDSRALDVSSTIFQNCPNLSGCREITSNLSFTEARTSRGPPLRKHQAVSLHRNTHRASTVERRVPCAPQ